MTTEHLPVSRKALAVGTLVICLYSIWVAGRWISADVFFQQAEKLQKKWDKAGLVETRAEWQRGKNRVDRARDFSPNNPSILSLAAQINLAYAYAPNPEPDRATRLLQQAEADLTAALSLRPKWAYDWANLAILKVRLWQIDDGFSHAIYKALEFGPLEVLVQRRVIRAGFVAWPKLDKPLQTALLDAFASGLRLSAEQTKWLFAIAERFRRTEMVCKAMQERSLQNYIEKYCEPG
ncbi:MAG: hypothetical protein ACI9GW_001648 [Halieaceae bacterium]